MGQGGDEYFGWRDIGGSLTGQGAICEKTVGVGRRLPSRQWQ